jgi:O-antigen/teichoic acid export membrane protein
VLKPPDAPGGGAGAGRHETALERWDRNLAELLQEVRVAQTGVQVLFAFLLTLPFSTRFPAIGRVDKVAYLITLIAAATATALLIAPVSYHRLVFRQGHKAQLVRYASVAAEAGLACLVVAVAGAVFMVVDVVSGTRVAAVLGALVAALYLTLWYVIPLRQRRRHG